MPSTQDMKDALANSTSLSPQSTLLVVVLVVALTALTWIGKVNGDAFVSLASAIIGGVLVRSGVASGSSNGSQAPPP